MHFKNIYCTLLIGPTIPVPIPAIMAEALQEVEVIQNDNGRSGFQITFHLSRKSSLGTFDYTLLEYPMLKALYRVVILTTVNSIQHKIMDGVITHIQLNPGTTPGSGKMIVTGEDISLMLDINEKIVAYPDQTEFAIARKILTDYSYYDLVPNVVTPPVFDFPNSLDYIPIQHETDLAYLKRMAARFGYVFYIDTGPKLLLNTAYWGPPKLSAIPQASLSVAMGVGRNVKNIQFNYDALAPVSVSEKIQDRESNEQLPIQISKKTEPSLSRSGTKMPPVRQLKLSSGAGFSYAQAQARAQARTNVSYENVVSAEGELDAVSYGNILRARSVVSVKGAGKTYDGLYYVKQVTHQLGRGYYRQQFKLRRDGIGSTVNRVPS